MAKLIYRTVIQCSVMRLNGVLTTTSILQCTLCQDNNLSYIYQTIL